MIVAQCRVERRERCCWLPLPSPPPCYGGREQNRAGSGCNTPSPMLWGREQNRAGSGGTPLPPCYGGREQNRAGWGCNTPSPMLWGKGAKPRWLGVLYPFPMLWGREQNRAGSGCYTPSPMLWGKEQNRAGSGCNTPSPILWGRAGEGEQATVTPNELLRLFPLRQIFINPFDIPLIIAPGEQIPAGNKQCSNQWTNDKAVNAVNFHPAQRGN